MKTIKKILLLGVPAILVVLLIAFGPALLDLYRLISFIEQSNEAYEANGGPWPQLADTCAGCHGVNGSSLHQAYPSLAGQPAAYTAAQLQVFASGQRASPTMGPLAMILRGDEVKQLAEYYARQPVVENRWFKPDPALREKGRQLVIACAACHGNDFMGQGTNPRLAAQGHDYLLEQLAAYADGTRTDPAGAMNALAAAASSEDRKAMAAFLASLAPAQPTSSPNPQE